MIAELKERARRLVDASRELGAADREPFLRQACRDSAELWVEVQQLLNGDPSESPEAAVESPNIPSGSFALAELDPVAKTGRAGKFEIVARIGSGGFGVVYQGRDPVLKRTVAVKTCTSEDAGLRKRFFREAEIAARLQHPNITTVHELGIQDGIPFLVQEYLAGEDLEEKIERREDISVDTRLRYLEQIARGLAYAHSQDVVHRDIKPGNIRVLEDDSIKIMDFGIARLLNEETRLTSTGMAIGTVGYLAPEQLRAEDVDHRADIFSFGVMAYELLAYERPFRGSNFSQVCYQLLQVDPPALDETWPGCDLRMAVLIARCLSKNPEHRPDEFSEIEAKLVFLRKSWKPSPIRSRAAEAATELLDTGHEPMLEHSERQRADAARASRDRSTSRTPWGPVLFGFALTLLAVLGVGFWWLQREPSDPASTAETVASVPVDSQPRGLQLSLEEHALPALETTPDVSRERSPDESTGVSLAEPAAIRDEPQPLEAAPQPRAESQPQSRGRRPNRAEMAPVRESPETPAASSGSVPPTGPPTGSSTGSPEGPAAMPPTRGTGSGNRPEARESDDARVEASVTVAKTGAGSPAGVEPVVPEPAAANSALPAVQTEEAELADPSRDLIKPGTADKEPLAVKRIRPRYPDRARRRGIRTRVVVGVLVDAQGGVERTVLLKKDESGLGFNEAAVEAARKTRFVPATQDGVPGRMWTELSFDFRPR